MHGVSRKSILIVRFGYFTFSICHSRRSVCCVSSMCFILFVFRIAFFFVLSLCWFDGLLLLFVLAVKCAVVVGFCFCCCLCFFLSPCSCLDCRLSFVYILSNKIYFLSVEIELVWHTTCIGYGWIISNFCHCVFVDFTSKSMQCASLWCVHFFHWYLFIKSFCIQWIR